jgi:heme-degrading monooxygenase HmoA
MFVILWHFEVKPGNVTSFQNVYGPDGEWARLFRRDPHFRGTQLLHDPSREFCYFTVDFWDSETAYRAFLDAQRSAYDELDASLEHLTLSELHVLSFDVDRRMLDH